MKKRLLVIMEAVQTNGAVLGWFGYIEAIQKGGWEVDVFLFDPCVRDGLTLPLGVRILPADIHCMMARLGLREALLLAFRKGRVDLFFKRLLFSLLQKYSRRFRKWNLLSSAKQMSQSYDVAIAATLGGTWKFLMEKVSASTKLLWVNTDVRNTTWSPWWRALKHYVEDAHGLACVSMAMRDQMRKDNPQWAEKIFAMNYVIDDVRIRRLAAEPSDLPEKKAFRLVTVGRYCQQKGQYLIPGIAAELVKRGLDFEWYIIGPGCELNRAEIEASLQKYGLRDRLFYREGMLNPFAEMATADLYVQPSIFEGYGLTVSEALVAGCYVVASDIPTFREQITSEDMGLFSGAIEEKPFADAILRAVERIWSGCFLKNYQTPYSGDRAYRQFLDILDRVSKYNV